MAEDTKAVDSNGQGAKTPAPTSRKDKITITISVLALLVSLATFGFTRWEKWNEARVSSARQGYSAFQLGERFAISLITYHQTRIGTPEAVQEATSNALKFARLAQGYADRLELGLDLRSFVEEYKPGQEVIAEPVTRTIESRLVAERGQRTSDHFSLGFWLVWWVLNTGIADKALTEGNRDMASSLSAKYPQFRTKVHELLKSMNVDQTLPEAAPTAAGALGQEIKKVRDAAEDTLRKRTAA